MDMDNFLTEGAFDDSVKQNTGPIGGIGGALTFLGVLAFVWNILLTFFRFFFPLI